MFKKMRVMLLVAVALFVFSGAASALDAAVKRVDVDVDGKVTSINTTKSTVSEVLADLSVTLAKDDLVQPPLTAEIKNDMKINVSKAFMVTISVDGKARYLRVGKGDVLSAKEKLEEVLKMKTKLVSPKETDELVPNMKIELATSYTERDEERSEIPFETLYVENDQVDEGVEKVLTEGSPGVSVTVYESLFEGEKLLSRLPVETRVEREKVDKVVEKGTKPLKPVVPENPDKPVISQVARVPGQNLYYTKVMTMRASAYTSDRGDAGTHTATGERARIGLVAVDPREVPLGTMLYVEGYGICRAADTGGMIKGNAIDLYFDTYEECVRFGRRNVTVYILEATREELVVQEKFGETAGEAENAA